MKINTKRFVLPGFLLALLFATTACGGSASKPVGGLDVSVLSPALLSISPIIAGANTEQAPSDDSKPAIDQQTDHSTTINNSTISNQQ